MMPSSRKPTSADLAAHLQMDVAGAGAFGLMDEFFQNFRRGAVGVFLSHLAFKGCSNRLDKTALDSLRDK